MNPYVAVISIILSFITGFLANPFRDWIQLTLNKKENYKNKREKLLEELYMLLPAIDKKVNATNHLLINRIMGCELKIPYSFEEYSTSITRIKYILNIELLAPSIILENFKDFENYIEISNYIILHELMSTAQMAPETNSLNQLITDTVKDLGGDHKKAAAVYAQEAKSKAKILISSIEDFIKKEKQNINQ